MTDDSFDWVARGDEVVAFERSGIECIVNFGTDPLPLPAGEVLVASNGLAGRSLPADTAVWLARSHDG